MPPAPSASPRARGLRVYAGVLISTLLLGYATGAFVARLHDAARETEEAKGRAQATRLADGGAAPAERSGPPDRAPGRRLLAAAADPDAQSWPEREQRLARVREGRGAAASGVAAPTRRSVQAAIDATDPRVWLAGYGPLVETPRTSPLGVD